MSVFFAPLLGATGGPFFGPAVSVDWSSTYEAGTRPSSRPTRATTQPEPSSGSTTVNTSDGLTDNSPAEVASYLNSTLAFCPPPPPPFAVVAAGGELMYLDGGGACAICRIAVFVRGAVERDDVRCPGDVGEATDVGVMILGVTEEPVLLLRREPFPLTESASSSSPSLPFFFFFDFLASSLTLTPVQS